MGTTKLGQAQEDIDYIYIYIYKEEKKIMPGHTEQLLCGRQIGEWENRFHPRLGSDDQTF